MCYEFLFLKSWIGIGGYTSVDWNEGKPIIKYIEKNTKESARETEEQKKIKRRERENRREDREARMMEVLLI